jgi:hypothetical protein
MTPIVSAALRHELELSPDQRVADLVRDGEPLVRLYVAVNEASAGKLNLKVVPAYDERATASAACLDHAESQPEVAAKLDDIHREITSLTKRLSLAV